VPSARELRAIVRDLNRRGHTVIYTRIKWQRRRNSATGLPSLTGARSLALGTNQRTQASLQREGVIRVEGIIPPAAWAAVERLGQAALTAGRDG